jgi:toxin ParE1/3/4
VVTVVFHPIAEDDLGQIFDLIAADSPERAIGYVRRIKTACLGFSSFPERGRLRNDLAENVRTLVFERRVVIAHRLEDRSVTILRVFYAGPQIDRDGFKD